LGPPQHACLCSVFQAGVRCGARQRRCLLKDCERLFSPPHPFSRYCSEACRQAARVWSRRCAAAAYRGTEAGREKRREQSRRYRERVRQRTLAAQSEPDPEASCEACEGHHPPSAGKKFSCQRPGCYEQFVASPRCPGQKFCCALCRQALRRVLRREARWWKRLRALFRSLPPGGIGGGSAVGCGGRS